MPDTEKYRNTQNLGSDDENKHGWKLGDIVHTAGSYVTANGYGYCGWCGGYRGHRCHRCHRHVGSIRYYARC